MTIMKKYWGVLFVLLVSYFAIQPFFVRGFFPIHDDTQVARVHEMVKALSDGHFPVRWVKDLGYGYGYPVFNFYAPLAYYVGSFVNLLGVDTLESTKVMMVIGILLAGVSMYFLAREFWGEVGGVISGLFYMYAPYHALDIYVRGAVGEFWAYAFLPLLALGMYKIFTEPKRRWLVLHALAFAGIILSHNLTVMMVAPFTGIVTLLYCYIAYRGRNLLTIRYTLYAIFLGLGISAFYWLPALFELDYTNVQSQIGGRADFRDHFVCLQQLWDSPWGFGGSAPGCIDGISLKIGKLHILASIICLFSLLIVAVRKYVYHYNDTYHHSGVVVALLIGFVLSSFLTVEVSKPIWELVSPMAFLQYPWRFLLLTSFFSSFLAGAVVWILRSFVTASPLYLNTVLYFSSFLIIVAALLLFNVQLFQPQTIMAKIAEDYTNEQTVKWTTSKISDEYMPREFTRPSSQDGVVKQRVSIGEITEDKTHRLSFTTTNNSEQLVIVRIAPFPAWKAFIDDNITEYQKAQNGLVIQIPQGKHTVTFAFVSTGVERLGNIMTLVSIFVLIGGILEILRVKGLAFFKT